ncbi:hypothetical protein GGI35DRAFT_476629 [Trichoderma velutinum]
MDNIPAPKWNVEIYELFLSDTSFRSATGQVSITTGPEVDVGWISSATVLFFYGQTLIGEMALENTIINTEVSDDVLVLGMVEFEIQNMIAFKSFVRDIMPKSQNGCQTDKSALTGKLEVVEKGHSLTLAIDLRDIGCLKTTKPNVKLAGDLIEITFSMTNPTSVEIYFDEAEFELLKDRRVLATLSACFNIEVDKLTYKLEGQIASDARGEIFGNAVLTGYDLKGNRSRPDGGDKTWLIHALREFKLEVNLDQIVACKDE